MIWSLPGFSTLSRERMNRPSAVTNSDDQQHHHHVIGDRVVAREVIPDRLAGRGERAGRAAR